MIQCLSEGQGIEVGSSYWRHVAVMRRLEKFLEANADRTLHLTDLCAAAAAPDRTPRILCHEHLRVSPTRYLWLRRMHLARRALRMADLATTTVTEIATSYAFWELGHFAVAYRSLSLRPHALASRARGGAFWRAGWPRFDKLSCAISANL